MRLIYASSLLLFLFLQSALAKHFHRQSEAHKRQKEITRIGHTLLDNQFSTRQRPTGNHDTQPDKVNQYIKSRYKDLVRFYHDYTTHGVHGTANRTKNVKNDGRYNHWPTDKNVKNGGGDGDNGHLAPKNNAMNSGNDKSNHWAARTSLGDRYHFINGDDTDLNASSDANEDITYTDDAGEDGKTSDHVSDTKNEHNSDDTDSNHDDDNDADSISDMAHTASDDTSEEGNTDDDDNGDDATSTDTDTADSVNSSEGAADDTTQYKHTTYTDVSDNNDDGDDSDDGETSLQRAFREHIRNLRERFKVLQEFLEDSRRSPVI